MELLDILDKIAKETEISKININDLPQQVRDGWNSRINVAKIKLDELKALYSNTLFDVAIPLFLVGDKKTIDEIGQLLVDYGSGLGIDANDLYDRICDKIEPMLGTNRVWISDYTEHVNAEFGSVFKNMQTLGFKRIAPEKPSFSVPDRKSLFDTIKSMIVKSNGILPNNKYLARTIRDRSLSIGLNGEPYIVVGNLTPQEAQSFSNLFKQPGLIQHVSGDAKTALNDLIKSYQKAKESSVKKPKKQTGR